ncbi:MAG TPA: (deoxy)nucleoside triphosphate pyrophosphohydrolase [Candidatus Limnocylindria bacterium]|nr:(deoxy)nucleoside triphosphate pyrophosphohydrolase [Candidatus Limnocylindria bacterium]
MSETLDDSVRPKHARLGDPTRLRVAAAVIWRSGRLLLAQRPPGGPLGLQWELPGGKIELGESVEHALVRELEEELGVHATAHEILRVDSHDYPHGLLVELSFVRCTIDRDDLRPNPSVHAVQWVAPEAIDLSTVLAGDRAFLKALGTQARS